MKHFAVRALALAMSAACMLTMTACGGDDGSNSSSASQEAVQSVQQTGFSDGGAGQEIELHNLDLTIPDYLDTQEDASTEESKAVAYTYMNGEERAASLILESQIQEGEGNDNEFMRKAKKMANSIRKNYGKDVKAEESRALEGSVPGWYERFTANGLIIDQTLVYDSEKNDLIVMTMMHPEEAKGDFDFSADYQQILASAALNYN